MRLRAWGCDDSQSVTIYRRRLPVAELSLQRSPADFEIEWPRDISARESETLYFRFARSAPVKKDLRPLAAGFDRIELVD